MPHPDGPKQDVVIERAMRGPGRIAGAFFVPAVLASALSYKIIWFGKHLSHLISSRGYGALRILQHDLPIFSALLFLFYFCVPPRPPVVRVLSRLCLLFLVAIYLLDIGIMRVFNCHAVTNDIVKYTLYAPRVLGGLFADILTLRGKIGVSVSLLFGLAVVANFLTVPLKLNRIQRRSTLLLALAGMGLAPLKGNDEFCHAWAYQNVFEYNMMIAGQNKAYSRAFEAGLKARYHPAEAKRSRKTQGRRNIIVVILESVSPCHSGYFSSLNNTTPNIDRIAEANISFPNFFANGFTTEDCLISVLTGLPPLAAPGIRTDNGGVSFEGFFDTQNPLPKVLKQRGYTCEFLTAGDLKFSNKGTWLTKIGFDRIAGHELPCYKKWKRYQFNAAPDQALFERALERIFLEKMETPFFMMIETVSGHAPYINPENNRRSEMETIAYVDRQAGRFYDQLSQNGFFESGWLVIVGDHRIMTPLTKPEVDLYGIDQAPARVPLILCLGKDARKKEAGYFQQTDLYSSIINYVSDEARTTRWQGDLLSEPRVPPEFIIFKRGDLRNVVSVFQKDRSFRIRLDGNKTSFCGQERADPDTAGLLLDRINGERIARATKG